MFKGALIFAAGLGVGTIYGVGYGLRLSKAMVTLAEEVKKQTPTPRITVPGETVYPEKASVV